MLNTFAAVQLVVFGSGGVAALVLGYSWLAYRLAACTQGHLVTAAGGSLVSFLRGYGFFLIPWLLGLGAYRSLGVTGAPGFTQGVLLQQWLLVVQVTGVGLLARRLALSVSGRWTAELGGSWLVLQLSWLLLSQSSSLLTTLLWFEIASLGGLLLLTVVTLGAAEVGVTWAAWRGGNVSRQTQLAFLQAALVFLWTSGVATILLLWSLSWGLVQTGSLNSDTLFVLQVFTESITGPRGGWGLAGLTGSGLVIKLLLQPAQLALLTFYRRLRLEALACYLVIYYCFFVPAFILVFYSYVVVLVTGGFILVLGGILGLSVGLLQGAAAGVDLRTTLAYSTAINLSTLLLLVGLR